jgi:hypothetical protein
MADTTTALPPKIGHVFHLAQIIQDCCEECTDQEATTLAKAILEHPESRWMPRSGKDLNND